MKKIRMIVSAVVVFAIVSSALAFKSGFQDLRYCEAGKCIRAPFDSQSGVQFVNVTSESLYVGAINDNCGLPTDPCQPYAPNFAWTNE